MAGTGIWLNDQDLSQTGGAVWAQQQIQQVHAQMQAGQDWASEQMARLQQQASAQVQALTPTPSPAPAPAPPPPAAVPTPVAAPVTPPVATPAPTSLPATPAPTPAAGAPLPTPLTTTPQTAPVPTPESPGVDPLTGLPQAGRNWAQQQLANLLNPSQMPSPPTDQTPPQTPQAAPTPTPAPTTTPTPSAAAIAPGAPAGPQPKAPGDLIDQARQAAAAAGIDPDIFTRQIQQESGFQPTNLDGSPKTSPAGAIGIAQFMPDTAKGLGVDPTNPAQSLVAAAKLDAQNLAKYGGDWGKALAAYNAGGGNVDKYGGIPPFQETQNYVNTILGGAQNLVQQGVQKLTGGDPGSGAPVNTPAQGKQAAAAVEPQRQFEQEAGLSTSDAYTACGPVAAVAFAQTYGRNPTATEAIQLARQVGWSPGQGMAGPQSEVALLNKMGVDAHMTSGVDWSAVASSAQSGNPVILNTPNHYLYVDGYNADTGQYHVGASGQALKGGSDWMTPDQIAKVPGTQGAANAAIFVDHPIDGTQATPSINIPQPGQSPHPMPGQPGGLVTPPGTYNPAPGSLAPSLDLSGVSSALKSGQDLAASLLNPPNVQQQGNALLSSLGQTGQNLLGQAATTPQSIGDLVAQNALLNTGAAAPALGALGVAGAGQNLLSQAPAYLQQLGAGAGDWWQQQEALAAPYQSLVGPQVDLTKPLGPQLGIDPYGQIVQQGVPQIIRGVQQGNLGDIAGGVLQTALGAVSALPGAGGESAAARALAAPTEAGATSGLPNFLSNLLRSRIGPEGAAAAAEVAPVTGAQVTPEIAAAVRRAAPGATSQQVLDAINTAAQRRIAMDDLLRSINADAAQRIAADDFLRDPVNYDEYGVLKGFQPPGAIQYSERGIQLDPLTGKEMTPPPPGPTPLPASATLEGLRQMATERGLGQTDILSQRLQDLTGQVNASMGQPLGGAQPGQISAAFARALGGGALGGLGAYQTTDPNDPNRWLKVAGATGAGALAGGPGLDLATQIPGTFGRATGTAPGAISLYDWARGVYRGGIVSGLNTMADVAANSWLTPAASYLTGTVRDLASLQPSRAYGRLLGAQSGIVNWTDNFLQGLSDSLSRPTSLTARATPGLQGIRANVAEGAGALHGGFMNATSELIQLMERGAAAGEAASRQGLSGQAWMQEFQNQLTNPAAGVAEQAAAAGNRAALRAPLGTLTGAMAQGLQNAGPVGDALFPVYRIGMNAAMRTAEYSPVGLAGTGWDVVRGLTGVFGGGPYRQAVQAGQGLLGPSSSAAVGPIAERLSNNLLGTAVSLWLASKASSGDVTGSGPEDPAQRKVWLSDGNQPDSFRGPDGQFHSWDKLPVPIRGPMMMAGAYGDSLQAYNQALARQGAAGPGAYNVQDPRFAQAEQLVTEVTRQLISGTPARTLAGLYDTFQSGGSAGSAALSGVTNMVSGVVGGAIPASGLVRSIAQMTDPSQRVALAATTPQQLPQSIAENIMQNVPGLRETLPARQDVLGRPFANPLQGLGELSPFRGAPGVSTPILEAMQSAGVAPTPPPPTIAAGPYEIRLMPDEQRAWQRSEAQIIQQAAGSMVASPDFQAMPAYTQGAVLKRIDQTAAHVADMQMLAQITSTPGALQKRGELPPGGRLTPVVGYGPNALQNQVQLQQQLQGNALVQALIGQQQQQPSSMQRLQALMANAS